MRGRVQESDEEMSFFTRALDLVRGKKKAALRRAEREEALGNLGEATVAYLEAEAPVEASRVLALRADAATAPSERLLLLAQAARHAQGEAALELRLRRAQLCVDLLRSGELSLTPHEEALLARELASMGQPTLAAEIYARMGDSENQAKMLVEAGAIDRLEKVLDAQQERTRSERKRVELHSELKDLCLSGRRREALELGSGSGASEEEAVIAFLRDVELRKVVGTRVRLEIDGQSREIAFGTEVLIGRADATVTVPSPAVSREHLVLRRGPEGPEAVDLGSRNGTLLRGVKLATPLTVREPVELSLGGEVPLTLAPIADGGLRIECGEQIVDAPLGALSVGSLRIAPGADGWLEVDARGAFLGGLRVDGTIELCRGDELSESVGGPVRVRVGP